MYRKSSMTTNNLLYFKSGLKLARQDFFTFHVYNLMNPDIRAGSITVERDICRRQLQPHNFKLQSHSHMFVKVISF